ncbi:cytochrome c oxidase assembly protein COX19 [Kwoniella heveanensis BCC8398]|uniref:Cytochrome c oxidase assembly protein COX19 n=1 Tax=Kwoniella heveanensis BCC8398 TaxID=1296120 RepID=A0A1B9GS19_9TREE|nr:cytochrome c oxidase assembly protein COX19 [Kwoniella heveanensis BCC8398]
MSSFGRPGFADSFKVTPPQRGSFPLDHDGECKSYMMAYMRCLKANANDNGRCRLESKRYLECRMDNNLMQRDDMSNLGLGDVVDPAAPSPSPSTTTASPSIPSSTTTSASASSLKPAPVDQSRI